MPATSLAKSGAGHVVASMTLLSGPIVEVAPAAAAIATVPMTPGYVMRPTVPSEANPAFSVAAAHPGMTFGCTFCGPHGARCRVVRFGPVSLLASIPRGDRRCW